MKVGTSEDLSGSLKCIQLKRRSRNPSEKQLGYYISEVTKQEICTKSRVRFLDDAQRELRDLLIREGIESLVQPQVRSKGKKAMVQVVITTGAQTGPPIQTTGPLSTN